MKFNIRHLGCFALIFSFALVATAFARERLDGAPFRVRLSADQIDNLTNGFTWTILNERSNLVTQTFFREDGVRFTKAGGRIDRLEWSIRPEGLRCVHVQQTTRCGLIANIDGNLTICMQIQPMGDCNYRIIERQDGDPFQLEALHAAQNTPPSDA